MSLPMETPDLFEYFEYRLWLRDAYEARKSRNPAFSHRYIAGKAGFGSSGTFARILDGSRNLSMDGAMALSRVFGLNRAEKEYFEHLVLHNQAEGEAERRFFLEKLAAVRKSRVVQLREHQMALFDDWRRLALRETLDLVEHRDDFQALGELLSPPASADEAREALEVLQELGLARPDEDGIWRKTEAVLTTPDEGVHQAVRRFQRDTMDLAKDALDRHPPKEREIATLTLAISDAMMERVKDKIRQLRREILEMAREDDRPDRVHQVNFQVFPLTRRLESHP
ncbi:MAG: TIGR02147 family protein [Fibrobacterota bacterium]|nr:MAG: TIGR02147 family protein [Fibrobacterota bacterium]